MQKKILPHKLRGVLACTVACATCSCASIASPFYMGGDVSLLPFIESRGGSFRDGGVVKPMDRIMVERGSNLFRLRLFVNPNPTYSATGGAIQDLASTISLATRLKASGARILLDYHYSDTWADPSQQAKPAAWGAQSFDALKTTLRTYTRDSLIAFRDAGVMPEMVQVGNEVTNGMLWPSGQVVYSGSTSSQNQSWRNFGDLLNAAITGVRDVDATVPGQHTQIAIHADGGSVAGRAQYYVGKLTNTALVSPSSYDILGLSFYPASSGDLANLQGNLDHIATNTTLKAMVLEANQPWKGSANGSQWASTQAGQRDYWIAVRDAVRNLPNGKGLGALWWYPESIQVPATNIWKGGAVALFDDSGGDALPALAEFSLGGSAWAINASGDWHAASSWVGAVPNATAQVARFGPNITAARSISLNADSTVGNLSFLSANAYHVIGTGRIVLDANGGAARIDVLQGNHTIDVPTTSLDDVEINAAWTHSLSMTQPIDAGVHRVTKVGAGDFSVARIDAGALDVQFGTLRLTGSTPGIITSLAVGAQGHLELVDAVVVDVAPGEVASTESSIRALVAAARLVPIGAPTRIGYADAALLGTTQFLGTNVDASSVLVRATIAGDANLDRSVGFDDLLLLAQNYGAVGAHWWQGDFDSNGSVGFDDLLQLAQRYGGSVAVDASFASGGELFRNDLLLVQSLLPEPTSVLLLAMLSVGARRRMPASSHISFGRTSAIQQ